MPRNPLLIAVLVFLAFATAGVFSLRARHSPPPELHGTLLEPPLPVRDFALSAGGAAPVRLQDFRGRLVVLFFGYTACPDVCPLTMQRLASAVEQLGERAAEVQVVLISVDPGRDEPARVHDYATRFHPGFVGVTGSDEEIRAVATAYGIFYERSAGSAASGYLVDHSASVLVLDREGRLRLIVPSDVGADELAADLRYLLGR